MAFPSPTVTPPTFTMTPSVYFNGITFSGAGPFLLKKISGIDMPTVRSGDTDAPRTHGQFIGLDLLSGRDVELTFDVGPPFGSYTNLPGAMAALRAALTPSGTTETPLFVQLPNGSMYTALVRPRKRSTDIDIVYTLGNLAQNLMVQFHATDAMMYSTPTAEPSTGLGTAGSGADFFNLTFNFSFGGTGGGAGVLNATNSGDVTSWPIFIITGPCTYPKITNASISGNPSISFGVTMLTGDQLIINTDPKYRSAVYYNSGSAQGATTLYTLQTGSAWFGLNPGANQIQFTTLDSSTVAATLAMEWASSYSAAA